MIRFLLAIAVACATVLPTQGAAGDDQASSSEAPKLAGGNTQNLAGGVMIVHTVPELSYTNPQPKGGYCNFCDLTSCDGIKTQVGKEPSVWFVISAWTEPKIIRAAEFGLGDFDPNLYVFLEHGPCWQQGMAIYHNEERQWPAPNTGIALATIGDMYWRGQFVPMYWFAGYQYEGTGTIPLTKFQGTDHAGWTNPGKLVTQFDAACLGALGVGVPGVACCPQAPDTTKAQPSE